MSVAVIQRPPLARRPAQPREVSAVELPELVRALRRRRHTIVKIAWMLGVPAETVREHLYPRPSPSPTLF